MGGQELVDKHEALIKAEKAASEGARRMRTAAEELEDCEKRLKELEPEQARLERRQRHVEKARLCEQRLAWVKFEEKRELASSGEGGQENGGGEGQGSGRGRPAAARGDATAPSAPDSRPSRSTTPSRGRPRTPSLTSRGIRRTSREDWRTSKVKRTPQKTRSSARPRPRPTLRS